MAEDPVGSRRESRERERATRLGPWAALLVLLVLFTAWVQWWFVPHHLVQRDRAPARVLRAPGPNIGALFDMVPPREAPDDVVVALVGDSSVGSLTSFGVGEVAAPLADRLHALLPDRRVTVLDLSRAGLYAQDALLLVAKALAVDVDVVVLATSARQVPRGPLVWASQATDIALQWGVVRRVGLGRLVRWMEPEDLARALVHSYWPPARVRPELYLAALDVLGTRRPGPLVGTAALLFPGAARGQPGEPWRPGREVRWPRVAYGIDAEAPSTEALWALLALCGREPRCLVTHVPVNPAAPHAFEPGLADDFVARVAARARTAGVPFDDDRNALAADGFVTARAGSSPDAIHPTPRGSAAFAAILAPRLARLLGAGAP